MSNEYGQDQPASTIPDELPPRPQPTVQRGGFRNCLTFKFLRSYSLRGVRDRRTKFRRIAMIVVLFILAGMAVLDFVFTIISNLGLGIVFTILDVFFLWAMAWSLAVIGDAVGVKKFMGMTFGRTFFDVFIGVIFVAYSVMFVVSIFTFGLYGFQGFWLGFALLIFLVAYIASEPPVY